jgi:hypothetical protein
MYRAGRRMGKKSMYLRFPDAGAIGRRRSAKNVVDMIAPPARFSVSFQHRNNSEDGAARLPPSKEEL